MADTIGVGYARRTLAELENGLDTIRDAPKSEGTLELIVGRPAVDQRVELVSARLDTERGLIGDRWSQGSRPNPKSQITLMNVRAAQLVAGDRSRWQLAGDQLYVDFDVSSKNVPPGTRLGIGSAVLEVSDQPHLGCEKFSARFGEVARAFANSSAGTAVNFRGINTRVVTSGNVRVGDAVRKLR